MARCSSVRRHAVPLGPATVTVMEDPGMISAAEGIERPGEVAALLPPKGVSLCAPGEGRCAAGGPEL